MDIAVDTFLTTVYCVVDDLYQARYAAHKPVRRGPAPEMSDSEVLTVVVLAQWQQDRSEAAFLRYGQAPWRGYSPRLLRPSACNRRARDLLGVLCQLGPQVGQRVATLLAAPPAYGVLDTVPVPLMRCCRGVRHHLFAAEAAVGRGGSEVGRQFGVQAGVVVFDGEEVGGALSEEELGQSCLRVERIRRDDPSAQREMGQELLRDGDLVRLVVHAHLHQGLLGRVRRDREQMRGRVRGRPRSPHRLAVAAEGLAVAHRARLLDPTAQRALHVGDRQARQQAAIERACGRAVPPPPADPREQSLLIAGPAAHRLQRVTVAEQRGHQAGEQKGQVVALPTALAWIGNRGEGAGQGP